MVGPKECSHGKLPLLINISFDGQPVFLEQAVESPLGHPLVVRFLVPRVVERHLKFTNLLRGAGAAHLVTHHLVVLVVAVRGGDCGGVGASCGGTHSFISFAECSLFLFFFGLESENIYMRPYIYIDTCLFYKMFFRYMYLFIVPKFELIECSTKLCY